MNKKTKKIAIIVGGLLLLYWVYKTYFAGTYKYAEEGDTSWMDDFYGGGGVYTDPVDINGNGDNYSITETAGGVLPEGFVVDVFGNWVQANPEAWEEYVAEQQPTPEPVPPTTMTQIINPTGLTSTGVPVPTSTTVQPRARVGSSNLGV